MIQNALFSKFRVSEFLQFFNDAIKLCEQNPEAAAQFAAQLAVFKTSSTALANSFKTTRGSEITLQLTNLDNKRDQGFVCLRKIAEAYALHLDEELSAAGKALLSCIDKYGSRIHKLNYQAETSTLANLCNELTTSEKMIPVVTKLGKTELVNTIANINNEFNELYLSRISENSAKTTISSSEAIKQTTSDYRLLIEHIQAFAIVSPSESNTKLQSELNTLITRYNTTIEQRISSGAEDTEIEENIEVSENTED